LGIDSVEGPREIVHVCIEKVKYTRVQAVRPIGGVEVKFYSFMTTTLDGGEGSESRLGHSLPPGKTRYL
jgi:hypothetical protein